MAYQSRNYIEVVTRMKIYQSISTLIEPDLRWMAGQAYLELNQWDLARQEFDQLLPRTEGTFRSNVFVAQARVSLFEKDTAQSIQFLEQAILEDPAHLTAQYNYELLKKLFQPPADPSSTPTQAPSPAAGQVIVSAEKEAALPQDPPTRIPRERALQMLDNLRSNERSMGISKKNAGSTTNTKNDW